MVIIQLILSLLVVPKVITLSGYYCIIVNFYQPGNVYDDKLYLLHDVHTEVFDPETMRWSSWPQPPPTSPDQVIFQSCLGQFFTTK